MVTESTTKASSMSSVDAKTPRTAKEIEKYWLDKGSVIERFENAQKAVQLINAAKNETRTYSTFSKETLRTYLQNPASYYKMLRNLSRFLYYRCQSYRRLIWYNAGMIDTKLRVVIPLIDLVKENNPEKVTKSYYNTLKILQPINLESELFKMRVIAWREDCAYGCVYYDDTGLFILPLDPDYCKVTSMYYDGTLGFSMDMSYFDKYTEQLAFYGAPFDKMYQAYQADKVNGKWQPMPDEHCFCLKINLDDATLPLPPYFSLFNAIISLCDSEELQAVRDEADIYKLLVLEMETIDGAMNPDEFTVDPSTAVGYYNKLVSFLPEYVNAAISPVKITPIEFNQDQTSDINYIQNSTAALFNSSGGGQILNSANITTATPWADAMISDGVYATATVRPQLEKWINRWLSYVDAKHATVKLLDVTPYTKQAVVKTMKEDATYGLPLKLALNSLNGFSELETLSLNYLEEDCLHLSTKFVPLQSSNTQSGSPSESTEPSGAPEKDSGELSDSGEAAKANR